MKVVLAEKPSIVRNTPFTALYAFAELVHDQCEHVSDTSHQEADRWLNNPANPANPARSKT
jgi:hypothetical protein